MPDPMDILQQVMGKRTMNAPKAPMPQGSNMNPDAIIAMLLGKDPNNANPNMPPLEIEDGENGYWDAKNMGNGEGESFVMEDGEQRAADPVGNGATPEQLLNMIMGMKPATVPSDGKPEGGDSRFSDPIFARAAALWEKQRGYAPTSDGEFAEIEAMAAQIDR